MENCVAPSLDEFDVIIRSCIVFSQSRSKAVFLDNHFTQYRLRRQHR